MKQSILAAAVVLLLAALMMTQQQARAATPTPTPDPVCTIGPDYRCVTDTPTPLPSNMFPGSERVQEGDNGDDGDIFDQVSDAVQSFTDSVSGTVDTVVNFDPSQSLHDLVMDLLKGVFGELDAGMAEMLAGLEDTLWKVFLNTPDGGVYTTAAKPFSAIGLVLFVPFSILRVVWYNKNHLTGQQDSLLSTVADIFGAAFMIIAAGPIVDWTAAKVGELTALATSKALSSGAIPHHFGAQEVLAAASDSLPMLLLGGFLIMGAIFAVSALVTAMLAVHGMYYILVALAPIIFVLSLFPLLRWLNRLWWYGLGAVVLVPFIGAAAMGALGYIVSLNFGGDILGVKLIIRTVWLWSSAGLMWTLLGMVTKFTIGVTAQMGSKLVRGVAATASGLIAAGGMAAAGGIGGLGGSLGAGGGAMAGGGAVSGAEALSGAAASSDMLSKAAQHTMQAGMFGALSNIPGLGGLRGMAGYHRTLASALRLNAMAGAGTGAAGSASAAASAVADYGAQTFGMLAGGNTGYKDALAGAQKALDGLTDPDLGKVDVSAWASGHDPDRAALAGAVAALYHERSDLFADGDWFQIKAAAMNRINQLKGEE